MTKVASREQILRRVQAMLNQADHEGTSKTEAASFRAKAEELMAQYRIEESEAVDRGEAPSLVPVHRTMDVCAYHSPYQWNYRQLASYVAHHCGVKAFFSYQRDDRGALTRVLEMVGYESDTMFAEMLYASIRLAFAANLEPQYNAAESDSDNVYRMRNAGMTRDEIAAAIGWLTGTNGQPKLTPSAAADKASKLYGTACREKGSEPKLLGRSTNMKIYKEQYAEHFVTELYWRLMDSRNGVDVERGGLVLANRAGKVEEAFYERYPEFRPSTLPAPAVKAVVKEETPAQAKRREARWAREQAESDRKRNSAGGQAGAQAGRAAAKKVDLQGTQPTKRLA